MACATMRAFANVKSSAMMARQPSVPKRIELICIEYTRYDISAHRPDWLSLQQILALLVFEPSHDSANILGALAGADQQGVGSLYHDEIAKADGRDEFRGGGQKGSLGVEGIPGRSEEHTSELQS